MLASPSFNLKKPLVTLAVSLWEARLHAYWMLATDAAQLDDKIVILSQP